MRGSILNKPKKFDLFELLQDNFIYYLELELLVKFLHINSTNHVINYLFHHHTYHCWTLGANEGQKHLR
jgi:Ca2+-binding EF-hand superfamily protein